MPIFAIDEETFTSIPATTFAKAGINERHHLQQMLQKNIDVIAPDTLVLAEEFGNWEDSQRRIDLLAIDRGTNLVVIELKRTEDGGHMELHSTWTR